MSSENELEVQLPTLRKQKERLELKLTKANQRTNPILVENFHHEESDPLSNPFSSNNSITLFHNEKEFEKKPSYLLGIPRSYQVFNEEFRSERDILDLSAARGFDYSPHSAQICLEKLRIDQHSYEVTSEHPPTEEFPRPSFSQQSSPDLTKEVKISATYTSSTDKPTKSEIRSNLARTRSTRKSTKKSTAGERLLKMKTPNERNRHKLHVDTSPIAEQSKRKLSILNMSTRGMCSSPLKRRICKSVTNFTNISKMPISPTTPGAIEVSEDFNNQPSPSPRTKNFTNSAVSDGNRKSEPNSPRTPTKQRSSRSRKFLPAILQGGSQNYSGSNSRGISQGRTCETSRKSLKRLAVSSTSIVQRVVTGVKASVKTRKAGVFDFTTPLPDSMNAFRNILQNDFGAKVIYDRETEIRFEVPLPGGGCRCAIHINLFGEHSQLGSRLWISRSVVQFTRGSQNEFDWFCSELHECLNRSYPVERSYR